MKLSQIMTRKVQTCPVDAPLTEAARIMAEVNCGAVPVVNGEQVVGVVTDRDIVVRVVARKQDPNQITCGNCMSKPVATASPEMSAQEASDLMAEKQIRRLPVVEGNRLVGIVALGDLATKQIHVDEAGEALSTISEPSHPNTH